MRIRFDVTKPTGFEFFSIIRASSHIACVALLLFAAVLCCEAALPARSEGVPRYRTDSLAADTLIYVDSSQPRFRAGGFIGPSASTALLQDVPLEADLSPGFFVGLRGELEFASPLYFLLEFEFVDRRLYATPSHPGTVTKNDFHFYYFQFPILFQFHIPTGRGPRVTTGFGAVPSIVLGRKQVIGNEMRDTTLSLDTGVQNFDFGFELRVGTEWSLTPISSLTVDLRYLLGLQNILILATREDPRVWKARTLGLSLGWVYQLQRPIYRE